MVRVRETNETDLASLTDEQTRLFEALKRYHSACLAHTSCPSQAFQAGVAATASYIEELEQQRFQYGKPRPL